MKYVQYGRADLSKPGLLHNEKILNLSGILRRLELVADEEYNTLRSFIEAGVTLWEQVKRSILESDASAYDDLIVGSGTDESLLDAPLRDAKKLILLAGNYRGHIKEVGFRVPDVPESVTPQFFMKPPSTTLIGPGDPIRIRGDHNWIDWEVELAVVIGKKGRDIPEDQALEYAFGYTILNDVSEREFNAHLSERFVREKDAFFDWLHGKWFDTFAPLGPVIVTKDEIPDPHNLRISLRRNGKVEQDANTSQMIHRIPYLIHKLSSIVTIEPGDILSTGTPSGVGHSKGLRLESGDVLECRIEGIGTLSNPVIVETG